MLVRNIPLRISGATLWHGDAPDLILMAPSPPSGEILQRAQSLYKSPRLHDDFAQLGMQEAAGLFGFYLLDDAGLRKFSSGAQINTDDRTLLEYHAPRSLLVHGLEDKNRDAILLEQRNPLPEDFPQDARDAALAASAATSVNQDDARWSRALFARARQSSGHRGHRHDSRARRAGRRPIFRRPPCFRCRIGASIRIRWKPHGDWPKPTAALATTKRRAANCSEFSCAIRTICGRSLRWQNWKWIFRAGRKRKAFSAASSHPIRMRTPPRTRSLREILLREDKLDEAYRAMLDCLAQDPYNYQAHLNLGELLARQE